MKRKESKTDAIKKLMLNELQKYSTRFQTKTYLTPKTTTKIESINSTYYKKINHFLKKSKSRNSKSFDFSTIHHLQPPSTSPKPRTPSLHQMLKDLNFPQVTIINHKDKNDNNDNFFKKYKNVQSTSKLHYREDGDTIHELQS